MINCSNCGAENSAEHSFCSSCGSGLGRSCPSCGTANEAGNKFCFNCGSGLSETPAPKAGVAPSSSATSDSGERRLVSIVFADLVGYTTLSEGRDPEDIRSMLTEYYDRCREIIARYGGVTDKFIGDAVMGVFGADEAHEDDAERATRTALELVDMVQGLGGDVGMPGLDARAGVMSGEASVGSGGNDHGLVVGDLVNTASRLQSIAPPGGVYVGESTKDLVGGVVELAPVGPQHVKGKELAVEVFQAKRVVASSQTKQQGDLAEGPFVGRSDELRLLKDQLHATGRESSARLVSVIGEGGIGKTRISQELVRYIDGIAEVIYYHNGRSPSYGEGVTFWALGEMIRQRAGILEGEDAAKSRMKLRTTVAEFASDEEDQRWIEPRLAALIGLGAMPPGDRSELYAALRTFFQRIAENGPVLMVFEDLHWADEGLLDFIEELVERSTQSPILVLALARPELLERRQDWGATRRRSLLMHLSRLTDDAMRELVLGLAAGIPDGLAVRIAKRAAGIPLHAVEFVRMLINTGRLVAKDDGHVLEGDIEELAIPDSVNAIIGARLDRLDAVEATLIQDASVLGLSFTLAGIAEMQGRSTDEVEPTLRALVKHDILELDESPRSPERGQYRFVQSLIREVAYGRLAKQDRVKRHLEIARRTEALNDPELAGVVAGHYASAAEADPSNGELVKKAREATIASAERAAELGSELQAVALYRQAIGLTNDLAEMAELKLRMAIRLEKSGREDLAEGSAEEAMEFFRSVDDEAGMMRAATVLAEIKAGNFEAVKAVQTILPVYEATEKSETADWARLASQTSRALALSDQLDRAIEVADDAIPVLERLDMVEDLLDILISKATSLTARNRWIEGVALFRGVTDIARERGLLNAEIRSVNNLVAATQNDTVVSEQYEVVERLIVKSGQIGWRIRADFFGALNALGSGDIPRALSYVEDAEEYEMSDFWRELVEVVRLQCDQFQQGVEEGVSGRLRELYIGFSESDDPQTKDSGNSTLATQSLIEGDFRTAIEYGLTLEPTGWSYPQAIQAGLIAAGLAGAAEDALSLTDRLVESDLKGRAFVGLIHLGKMIVAALEGNTETAVYERIQMQELWDKTMTHVGIAEANAVTAQVFPDGHPAAIEAAHAADDFFTSNGFKAYLDLYGDVLDKYRSIDTEIAV